MRSSACLPMRFPVGSKYTKAADHTFGGTLSSPTAAEYNFQREKRCSACAGNGNRSVLSRTSVLLRLTRHRPAKSKERVST
jgi:hypothetical protein